MDPKHVKVETLPVPLDELPEEWKSTDGPAHMQDLAMTGKAVLRQRGVPDWRNLPAAAEIYEHIEDPASGFATVRSDGSAAGEAANRDLSTEVAAAINWHDDGQPRFVLSDSLAAMLSLTKAPPLHWEHMPYRTFMIQVPWQYLPIPRNYSNTQNTYIVLSHMPVSTEITTPKPDSDGFVTRKFAVSPKHVGSTDVVGLIKCFAEPFGKSVTSYHFETLHEQIKPPVRNERNDIIDRTEAEWVSSMLIRLAANVVAYITQHRECVKSIVKNPKAFKSKVPNVFNVGLPKDVSVTRELRLRAQSLASSRSFETTKSMLAHMVRGHWKQQVHGAGRSDRTLKWIHPYERGSEDIGRVVESVVKLTEKP